MKLDIKTTACLCFVTGAYWAGCCSLAVSSGLFSKEPCSSSWRSLISEVDSIIGYEANIEIINYLPSKSRQTAGEQPQKSGYRPVRVASDRICSPDLPAEPASDSVDLLTSGEAKSPECENISELLCILTQTKRAKRCNTTRVGINVNRYQVNAIPQHQRLCFPS
jgi:hypothetical protein